MTRIGLGQFEYIACFWGCFRFEFNERLVGKFKRPHLGGQVDEVHNDENDGICAAKGQNFTGGADFVFQRRDQRLVCGLVEVGMTFLIYGVPGLTE